MLFYYVDTSALAKHYLPETGSEWIAALLASEPVTMSVLAVTELASVLARRTREGDLTPQQRDTIFRRFLQDSQGVPGYVMLGLTQRVSHEATRLLLTSPLSIHLRTLDALHLASARLAFARARRRGVANAYLVTSDRTLAAAASWSGFQAINPENFP
ncbi:MAG: PIN domain-containing protein [Chloroflexota bacterium]|nr:MAG: PIN domain-containing protein [Chloroflexota bacterium]